MEKLFRKQSQWLEKVRLSPEFRNAKFRVVLSHTEPQIASGKMNKNIRKLTEKLLADNSNSGRIHLWIAGHVHRYWRAERNSTSMVSRSAYAKKAAVSVSPVNWITCDGPKENSVEPDFSYIVVKCSPEKLHIKAVDDNAENLMNLKSTQTAI